MAYHLVIATDNRCNLAGLVRLGDYLTWCSEPYSEVMERFIVRVLLDGFSFISFEVELVSFVNLLLHSSSIEFTLNQHFTRLTCIFLYVCVMKELLWLLVLARSDWWAEWYHLVLLFSNYLLIQMFPFSWYLDDFWPILLYC